MTAEKGRTVGRLVLAAMGIALLPAMIGCSGGSDFDPAATKTVVVFLDRSGSTDIDREVYSKAMDEVVSSLTAGDRLILGPITASSVRDFVANIDFRFPPPLPKRNPLTDRELDHRKGLAARAAEDSTRLAQLRSDIDVVLAMPSDAQSTAILETLAIAEDIFSAADNRGILIFLSDMIETSKYNFNRTRLTPEFIERETAKLEEARLMPDLSGVHVYVVGAHADPPEKQANIEAFWQAFFRAAGARIGPGDYARYMHRFDG